MNMESRRAIRWKLAAAAIIAFAGTIASVSVGSASSNLGSASSSVLLGQNIVTQGSNGSGTPNLPGQQSGGVSPALPVGTCVTWWASTYGNYNNGVYSQGSCSQNIASISATAILYSKGVQIAQNTKSVYNWWIATALASKGCNGYSQCRAGDPYSGTDQQYFLDYNGWIGSYGNCFISGNSMICSGYVPPWNWS